MSTASTASTASTKTDGGREVLAASRAPALLATFNAAGVLEVADVHTARALARIGREPSAEVQLAAALSVRALRLGSVCIELDQQRSRVFDAAEESLDTADLPWPDAAPWWDAVRASPLVAVGADAPPGRPLRAVGNRLYLERYWQQEELVRRELDARAAAAPPQPDPARTIAALDRLFAGRGLAADEPDRQRLAAAVCALRWVTVIAGGPGTGKTTTVARLLALLRDLDPGTRVALAAPTGKAAARLAEAVDEAAAGLDAADAARVRGLPTSTLHRLLGWRPDRRSRFRHDRSNHLPYDVVVVDEMSMVPLTMTARLLEALRPGTRLVLVGDPAQLSPVEAGAVLADITTAPQPTDDRLPHRLAAIGAAPPAGDPGVTRGVVELHHNWRFGGGIGTLAAAIRAADDDAVVRVLRAGTHDVTFVETDVAAATGRALDPLADEVRTAGLESWRAATAGDVPSALAALERHRLLCAHRRGPYGVSRWAVEVERWLAAAIPGYAAEGEWYPGRPLLITSNDYELDLYNGDTGVVVRGARGARAVFARGSRVLDLAPVRLDAVQTVHAMTVHRAQGSQFDAVSVILPPADSPLLTRELLYTAVTRARRRIAVYGSEESVRRAVLRPAERASGLRDRLGQS